MLEQQLLGLFFISVLRRRRSVAFIAGWKSSVLWCLASAVRKFVKWVSPRGRVSVLYCLHNLYRRELQLASSRHTECVVLALCNTATWHGITLNCTVCLPPCGINSHPSAKCAPQGRRRAQVKTARTGSGVMGTAAGMIGITSHRLLTLNAVSHLSVNSH